MSQAQAVAQVHTGLHEHVQFSQVQALLAETVD